jgi:hypothetical protein
MYLEKLTSIIADSEQNINYHNKMLIGRINVQMT